MVKMMTQFSFSFLVSGISPTDDNFEDIFFEAGCDDATLSLMNGVVAVCFDREAEGYSHAVISAYSDTLKTGACIERFEPDFLVSKSEIAKRSHLSRAAITQYVKGDRSQDFPKPYARITTSSPLWDWVEVSGWLHKHEQLSLDDVVNARISRAVNYFVQYPNNAPQTGDELFLRQMKTATPEVAHAYC